jgi:hypothetical protein
VVNVANMLLVHADIGDHIFIFFEWSIVGKASRI